MSKQVRMLKKLFKGFSLVELIIVIAIIAILSVSAVMVLQKWIGESRDSRRLSDLETIKKSLTVNYVDSTTSENYPMPDEAETVTGEDGETVWYQGYFGSKAMEQIDNLNKAPKDPRGTGYEYSVTRDQQTWEVYAKLENGDKVSLVTNKAYAEEDRYIAKRGNYDGYIIGSTGDKYNLYNSPSLYIASGQLISGTVNNVYQEGETTDSSVTVTGVDISNLKDDNPDNDETVYNNIKDKFGLETLEEAEKVVKKADGDDGSTNIGSNNNFDLKVVSKLNYNTYNKSSIEKIDWNGTVSISGNSSANYRICNSSDCSDIDVSFTSNDNNISAGQYIQVEVKPSIDKSVVEVSIDSTTEKWFNSKTYTTVGSHTFTVPDGVDKLWAVAVGGGGGGETCNGDGGGGGGLRHGLFSFSGGENINIKIGKGGYRGYEDSSNNEVLGEDGGDSSFGSYMTAYGGGGAGNGNYGNGGCGNGGDGGGCGGDGNSQGGGGAAGYSGNGGNSDSNGSGGGGGGGGNGDQNAGGGGVGIWGEGDSGLAGSNMGCGSTYDSCGGSGGSGGENGNNGGDETDPIPDAGNYGGGGGGADCSIVSSERSGSEKFPAGNGGKGAVNIIW